MNFYTSGLHASLLTLKARLQDGELGEMLAWPYETLVPPLSLSAMLSHYYKILAGVLGHRVSVSSNRNEERIREQTFAPSKEQT